MILRRAFLDDEKFLYELDRLHTKTQFVKITVLDWQENPLQLVQGIVISGSININGSSSLRRTASLSVQIIDKDNLANLDHLFAINKKCFLLIGIQNKVEPYVFNVNDKDFIQPIIINYQLKYGEIVWFPLGLFIMFNPSLSHSSSGCTISMQLKDKMCLLNGDLGGKIHSSVNFSERDDIEYDKDGKMVVDETGATKYITVYTPVYQIIQLLVNHWGNEKLNNIIIYDVPPYLKLHVKWNDDNPVWMFIRRVQLTLVSENEYLPSRVKFFNTKLAALVYIKKYWQYYDFFADIITEPSENDFLTYLLKCKYTKHDSIGYKYTSFVYPSASGLTAAAGDTVTSVLDKIISILSNYEYFYDVYGNFVFREKQNSLNTTNTTYWLSLKYANNNDIKQGDLPTEAYLANAYRLSKSRYDFTGNDIVASFNNTLNYNNIKNDFVVWGAIKKKAGTKDLLLPCRFHLAIDKKPELPDLTLNINTIISTWGPPHYIELYKDDSDIIRGKSANTLTKRVEYKEDKTAGSKVGYQDSLPDILWKGWRYATDWRELLYYQALEDERLGTGENTILNNSYFSYYAELKQEFPKMYDLSCVEEKEASSYSNYTIAKGWNLKLTEQGDIDFKSIYYYLDFVDEDSLLGQYSINNIGKRSIIINGNNEKINCVFEPDMNDIVFLNFDLMCDDTMTAAQKEDYKELIKQYLIEKGQNYATIDSDYYKKMIIQDRPFYSCFEKIKDLLYQYTNYNNTTSFSILPIYHLLPNTRITIDDPTIGIEGDYIITSISLPLDASSTMNINAYKALEKI